VRWSGNDEAALALARDNALAIGAGHTFLIFLGAGFFPVNVLAAVRAVPEVCRIYCATANTTHSARRSPRSRSCVPSSSARIGRE
jgi:adenosine/AMP kinase